MTGQLQLVASRSHRQATQSMAERLWRRRRVFGRCGRRSVRSSDGGTQVGIRRRRAVICRCTLQCWSVVSGN